MQLTPAERAQVAVSKWLDGNLRHLPTDVREALEKYARDVENGTVTPWNPDDWEPTEYDEWLNSWLKTELPSLDLFTWKRASNA